MVWIDFVYLVYFYEQEMEGRAFLGETNIYLSPDLAYRLVDVVIISLKCMLM